MRNRPVFNLAIGALLFMAAGALRVFGVGSGFALIALSILTILPIIFGDWLEDKFPSSKPLKGGVPWFDFILSREALLPIFMVTGCLTFGYMSPDTLRHAVSNKLDIVVLILSFAIIAQGLKQSGYFKYAAFRVLEVCDGSTSRLTLYLFVLSSILTYFTSNDIVILVMTPIVLSLCAQSGFSNAKLLLLGQFVAANTLSMGLLIGSPTNIIVSSEIEDLTFFSYLSLMIVPSIFAVVAGFVFIHGINKFAPQILRRKFNWQYEADYRMPALKKQLDLTSDMRAWRMFFILVIIAIAWASNEGLSFFWITIPAGFLALFGFPPRASDKLHEWRKQFGMWWKGVEGAHRAATDSKFSMEDALRALPLQIVFFAFSFFAVAESLSREISLDVILKFATDGGLWWSSFKSMIGTATLVNVVNDLPASALVSEVAAEASAMDSVSYNVFMQSILAALNIACYITPIGALAGIIWFHILRDDGEQIETPTRPGLCLYGFSHFMLVSIAISILIPFFNLAVRIMSPGAVGGTNGEAALSSENRWILWVGLATLVAVFVAFLRILKSEKIVLGDLRAFLSAASWINVRSKRFGVALQLGISAVVVFVFGSLILATEEQLPFGIRKFVVWILVFLGSGYEDDWFPGNYLAKILAGIMPLIAIFVIVRLVQATSDVSGLEKISRRIARGEIVTRRSVIVDYRIWMKDFVREIWKHHENYIFQTILWTKQSPPLDWQGERDYDDIYTSEVSLEDAENLRGIAEDYRLNRADEIYLLSDRFYGSDGALWIGILIEGVAETLKGLDLSGVARGEDPEDHAGRLPRIFIWDDVRVEGISALMESLLIRLPAEWRENQRDKLVSAVAGTAKEKSWKKRREMILEFHSPPPA